MHQITVDGLVIDVIRKNIKHLRLTIYPPDGRVRVSAPLRADDAAVRQAITARLTWIRRQQARFSGQTGAAPRAYVTGETHEFGGQSYLLNVIEHDGPGKVVLRGDNGCDLDASRHISVIDLYVRRRSDHRSDRGSEPARRVAVLAAWYRAALKASIPPLLEKWLPVIGVEVAGWGVKAMRTRWGSCNTVSRRVWLNLELAKKPANLLEYVVVHELVHLLERGHGAPFKAHMDRLLPGWRRLRAELNHPRPHDAMH